LGVLENVISLKQHSVVRAGKTLEVFEAIKTRRSIRAFTNEEVSEEEVRKLIDAATHAPSAGNIQPWEFIMVRDPRRKRGLVVAALDQTFIEEAPVVIVVCADEVQSDWGYGARGVALYCLQDTAAAIQNMLLAACALGLGTCWVGAFNEEEVRRVVNTPRGVRPVAIVPVGHPAEKPSPRSRRSMTEIVHYETFRARK
jgi:nitroreductase